MALFEELRGRDHNKPWPLLPILAFIGPGGSGKSTLIEHLIDWCSPGGRPALPYARLDFTAPEAPTDLLLILVALRDQLQQQSDDQGKSLTFPRFDLGALIAQDPSTNKDPVFTEGTVRSRLSTAKQGLDSLSTVGSTLGFLVPYLPALIAGIKLAAKIPAMEHLWSHLDKSTEWEWWYREQGTALGLDAKMRDRGGLGRLYALTRPGSPEREPFVKRVLPAAFAADLYAALVEPRTPKAWSNIANVVVFLDGFEALQRTSRDTALWLLQGLTIEQRTPERTPLLLIVGSRDPLLDGPEETASVPFERTD